MQKIFIIGSSGHAKVIIDIVIKDKKYEIVGLIDDFKKIGEEVLGYKILGGRNNIEKLTKIHKTNKIIVGVGDNLHRHEIVKKLKKCNFIKAIHPSAQIGLNVIIGPGTVVMSGVSINTDSKVGKHCILNTNSSLDHDNIMCDFASLAPGSTTGGNVEIGKLSSICLGAKVINGVKIGNNTIIGSGSCVLNNIGKNLLAYGTPCKAIRTRQLGEKFL